MPSRKRPQKRRADRRNNPTRAQWIGGAIVVGTAAVATVAIIESRRGVAAALPSGRPLPQPLPLPPLPDAPEGAGVGEGVGTTCDLGPSYPGFTWDGIECVPGEQTPPGIYIVDDCTDFIFVGGDDGPQPDDLETRIFEATQAVTEIQGDLGVSYIPETDPTTIVTDFFRTFWPQCTWPPVGGPERIIQLYMSLSVLVGRMVVDTGGNVLGTGAADEVDELVAQRLMELGFTEFRPDLVPEIDLSVAPLEEEPPQPPEPELPEEEGPEFPPDDPGLGPGLLDLPGGGGVLPPSQQPGACDADPVEGPTQVIVLPNTSWAEPRVEQYPLWTAPNGHTCPEYTIDFGVCVYSQATTFGALDPYLGPPPDFGIGIFQITRTVDEMDWSQFLAPLTWKRQFRVHVRHSEMSGSVTFKYPATPLQTQVSARVDACPTRERNWPSPSFRVVDEEGNERLWNAEPRVTVTISGKQLRARIEYTGLPVFNPGNVEQPELGGRARLHSNPLLLNLKTIVTGHN